MGYMSYMSYMSYMGDVEFIDWGVSLGIGYVNLEQAL